MGLPQATADDVVLKAKDCPVLTARKVRVNGSLDVALFPEPPGTPPTNPVMRLQNPLRRPIEGVLVTKQTTPGSVQLFLPGDPTYDNLLPQPDPTTELVVQGSAAGMTVRLLAY